MDREVCSQMLRRVFQREKKCAAQNSERASLRKEVLKVVWNHLNVGASPSDAHPTLHKDQLALQGG